MRSSAVRAIQDVTASAQWVTNLLWLALASFTSSFFIGQIGLFGYGSELIEARAGRPENPNPDIDSNRLGDYLAKGIWPFLASFLINTVFSFIVFAPLGLAFGILIEIADKSNADGPVIVFMLLLFALIAVAGALFSYMLSAPFIIRGMVSQDFSKTFDFKWSLNFIKICFGDMVVSLIVFGILSFLIGVVGFCLCIVGIFPASGIIMGGYANLLAQWYEVYLSRGGEPAPPSQDSMNEVVDATIVN